MAVSGVIRLRLFPRWVRLVVVAASVLPPMILLWVGYLVGQQMDQADALLILMGAGFAAGLIVARILARAAND